MSRTPRNVSPRVTRSRSRTAVPRDVPLSVSESSQPSVPIPVENPANPEVIAETADYIAEKPENVPQTDNIAAQPLLSQPAAVSNVFCGTPVGMAQAMPPHPIDLNYQGPRFPRFPRLPNLLHFPRLPFGPLSMMTATLPPTQPRMESNRVGPSVIMPLPNPRMDSNPLDISVTKAPPIESASRSILKRRLNEADKLGGHVLPTRLRHRPTPAPSLPKLRKPRQPRANRSQSAVPSKRSRSAAPVLTLILKTIDSVNHIVIPARELNRRKRTRSLVCKQPEDPPAESEIDSTDSESEIVPVDIPVFPENVEISSSPIEPIASPVEPISSLMEPISSAVEPIASPNEPISSPIEPLSSPMEYISSPVEPFSSAVEPISNSVEPFLSPIEPIAPTEPIASLNELISSPIEPISSPIEPFSSAVEPISNSIEPFLSPIEPIAPTEPIASPVEPIASPIEPFSSPVESFSSPVESIASPIEYISSPIYSPIELIPSPIESQSELSDYALVPPPDKSTGYDPYIRGQLAAECWKAVFEAYKNHDGEGDIDPSKIKYPCVMPSQRDPYDSTLGLVLENIDASNKLPLVDNSDLPPGFPVLLLHPSGKGLITEKAYNKIVRAHNYLTDAGIRPIPPPPPVSTLRSKPRKKPVKRKAKAPPKAPTMKRCKSVERAQRMKTPVPQGTRTPGTRTMPNTPRSLTSTTPIKINTGGMSSFRVVLPSSLQSQSGSAGPSRAASPMPSSRPLSISPEPAIVVLRPSSPSKRIRPILRPRMPKPTSCVPSSSAVRYAPPPQGSNCRLPLFAPPPRRFAVPRKTLPSTNTSSQPVRPFYRPPNPRSSMTSSLPSSSGNVPISNIVNSPPQRPFQPVMPASFQAVPNPSGPSILPAFSYPDPSSSQPLVTPQPIRRPAVPIPAPTAIVPPHPPMPLSSNFVPYNLSGKPRGKSLPPVEKDKPTSSKCYPSNLVPLHNNVSRISRFTHPPFNLPEMSYMVNQTQPYTRPVGTNYNFFHAVEDRYLNEIPCQREQCAPSSST